MKRVFLVLLLSILFLGMVPGMVCGKDTKAEENIKPVVVRVKVNDDENFAKFDGLKVRVNNKPDEFFNTSYFITLEDLDTLAQKLKVSCSYDTEAKVLHLGESKLGVIDISPSEEDPGEYGTIFSVLYEGKIYFDLWGAYGGLGFQQINKLLDGVGLVDPVK